MRTFMLICIVALVVAVGMAYAVGLVTVASEHPEGRFILSVTVNTRMVHSLSNGTDSLSSTALANSQDGLAATGKIAAVQPEKNEFVISENIKDWSFQLTKNGQVFVNDREGKLADLQVGDEAAVTFDRQGPVMLARTVRVTRR
jgi:hypothetical protein